MTNQLSGTPESGERAVRRRVVLKLEVGADSWRELQYALNSLATEIAMNGRLSPWAVSGGYSSGWNFTANEDENITHDGWAAANEAFCATLRDRDEHPTGEDAEERLSGEAMPARAEGIAETLSPTTTERKADSRKDGIS